MSEHPFDADCGSEAPFAFAAHLDELRPLSTDDVLTRRDHARRQQQRLERDLIALEWLLSEQRHGSRGS